MNQQVADIALIYMLPLGITFAAILQAVSASTRYHRLLCIFLSIVIMIMDCFFYFAKNAFITYNCDGGLLLSFASLFIMSFIHAIKVDDLPSKIGHFFFSFFMFSGFLGIAYWDRSTFVSIQGYSPAEFAAENSRYQEYIASFEDEPRETKSTSVKIVSAGAAQKQQKKADLSLNEGAQGRLERYTGEAQNVIHRMQSIAEDIRSFEKTPESISEPQREIRGRKALALSNSAVALNKKVLGLFHPLESSEAHTELIQASESIRLAAYSLYNYAIQDNPEIQLLQYNQAMNQIVQMNNYISNFWNNIENLKQNYKSQTKEQ